MLRRSHVLLRQYRNLVDGQLVEAASTYGVINPSTGEVFAQAPQATGNDANNAVKAANAAFKAWSKTGISERKDALLAAVAKLQEPAIAKEIADVLCKEQGKPMWNAQFELGALAGHLTGFANTEYRFEEVLKEDDAERIIQRHIPLGVVAAITPWNFPLMIAAWKIGEALMTGNTVVLKPSPYTPLSTLMMGEAWKDVFPRGVLNVLSGDNDAGKLLTEHPDVAKVSFTGSTATGKAIQAAASGSLKRLMLELGGNDPVVILGDADVYAVVPQIMNFAFMNTGQICVAPKRIYVHENKYNDVVAACVKAANEMKVGDPFEEGTFMGPLNNAMQLGIVEELVEDARVRGATIHTGGKRMERPGYFYPATIISDVSEGAKVVDREQFGPVLPIMKFSTNDEAVRRANDSKFGLGASVWTSDPSGVGLEVATQLEAGTVWINQHLTISTDVPFGGAKESGIGRQMGAGTIESYTDTRVLRILKPKA